jgi:hypothetical protein
MKIKTILLFCFISTSIKSQTENFIFEDSFLMENHKNINFDFIKSNDYPIILAELIHKEGIQKHLDEILILDEYNYDYLLDNITIDTLKSHLLKTRPIIKYTNHRFYDSINNILEDRDQKYRGKKTKDMIYRKDSILKMDSLNFVLLKIILKDSSYLKCKFCPSIKSSIFIHIDNFNNLLEINKELVYLMAHNRFHPYTYFWIVDRAYFSKYNKAFFYYCINYKPSDYPNISKEEIQMINLRRKIFGLPNWPEYK